MNSDQLYKVQWAEQRILPLSTMSNRDVPRPIACILIRLLPYKAASPDTGSTMLSYDCNQSEIDNCCQNSLVKATEENMLATKDDIIYEEMEVSLL